MIARVGRYPFRSYGTFASDATFPFALETQTISLYPDFAVLARRSRPVGSTSR